MPPWAGWFPCFFLSFWQDVPADDVKIDSIVGGSAGVGVRSAGPRVVEELAVFET